MQTKQPIRILAFLLLFIFTQEGLSQTCSCGGAPLIGSQIMGSTAKGDLDIGLTYEYHSIENLFNEDTRLENETVHRLTQTALFEVNYGISRRLSFSGTFSFIRKKRTTGLQNPGQTENLITRGLGDGLFLLKYILLESTPFQPVQIAAGGGAKIPLGTTSLTNSGLALNADMQPGTGAWDVAVWSYISRSFTPHSTINAFWFNTYRRTGVNERFAEDDRYRFGNELVSTLGVTNSITEKLSYLFMVRYRSTSSDRLNASNLPNTGGKWVYLMPAMGYQMGDRLSVRLSGQLPVYQYLKGTQPTTSFVISGSVFFSLNNKKPTFIHGDPRTN